MSPHLRVVFIGSSITSSWGNGHASTYRALTRGLARLGHEVVFLERNVPWYARQRDLPLLPWGRVALYRDPDDLKRRLAGTVRDADLVVMGSSVTDGAAIGEWVTRTSRGLKAFYDLDTPTTLAELRRGDGEHLTRSLLRQFDFYWSTTGGPILERVQTEFGADRVAPLYACVDTETYEPADLEPRWDLGYLGGFAADRQPSLELLLAEPARRLTRGRFVVGGTGYPDSIAWPENVERRGHVAQPEHREFLGAQRFTLNVTRTAKVEAGFCPSARLFEAAACGTPVISDWWTGLDTFFEPGREILIAGGPIDVLALIRDVPESQRLLIADAARRRVLADHTADARAREIESHVLEPVVRTAVG